MMRKPASTSPGCGRRAGRVRRRASAWPPVRDGLASAISAAAGLRRGRGAGCCPTRAATPRARSHRAARGSAASRRPATITAGERPESVRSRHAQEKWGGRARESASPLLGCSSCEPDAGFVAGLMWLSVNIVVAGRRIPVVREFAGAVRVRARIAGRAGHGNDCFLATWDRNGTDRRTTAADPGATECRLRIGLDGWMASTAFSMPRIGGCPVRATELALPGVIMVLMTAEPRPTEFESMT